MVVSSEKMVIGILCIGAGIFSLVHMGGFDLINNKFIWILAGFILISKGISILSSCNNKKC